MSDEESKPKTSSVTPAETQNDMPAEFDPKQAHVVSEWKYTSPLINCRFDPSGQFVFSSAEDAHVQRWEFATGKHVLLEGHDSWVRDMVVSPDGKTVMTVGSDEQILYWPAAEPSPKPIRKIKAHQGWIRCADVSADGKWLATGGNDGLVKVWNAANGELVTEISGHQSHVYSVMFHPTLPYVVSGDLSGQVKQWETASGKLIHSFDAKDLHSYHKGQQVNYGGVRSLSLAPDGKRLACGGLHKASNPLGAINEPLIVVFQWEDQKKLQSLISEGVRGVIWRSFYLPNGSLLGASGGSGGGFLIFWNPGEEKSFHKLKLKDTVRGMDLHPDRLHVATTHWDRHLRVTRMTAKEAEQKKAAS